MPEATVEQTKQQLRAAFDAMIEKLQAARDAIDTPELHPVPADQRTLAEGYRYVIGFILNGIERALSDPLHPRFRRSIQPMNRSTIDNSDAVYLGAEIDGNHSYWLRGRALDSRHWRGEAAVNGPRAPRYVIFELASGYAGDSGKLSEMVPGSRINTSTLDCHALQVADDGSFEILIAPEKPADYPGNFMLSRRESRGNIHVGRFLSCRELFYDWANEDLLDLEILRIGCEQEPRPPLDPAGAIAMMDHIGDVARNQVHFWNAFNTITLETYGKVRGGLTEGDARSKPFMPTNDMNPPNALGIATGGGQSTNIYAGGVYLLNDDEALVIESRLQLEPSFMGFHLSNLWGESLDFESYQSNLNAEQMESEEPGVYRWVVCHKDPGVPNWVDTTGLPHGYLTIRWTYPEQPPRELWPSLNVQKVAWDKVADHFPNARVVSVEERQAAILMRHRHVQRRYRQY
ncbi:MAG: hypothetical protein O7F73_09055 [Gammaproteobacteria bacterium]|nr:hypothetical protein [Gammaproteobacteria bacterium]